MHKTVLLIVAVLLTSACQNLTEEQCQTADWLDVGYDDGVQGLPIDDFNRHREACAKHKVIPLREQYDLGHARGLAIYCQPDIGFIRGREGTEYLGVCSAQLEAAFLAAYKEGRLIGDHERELAALVSVKRSLEGEIKNIERRLDSRFFADLSRGERPRGVDMVLLSQTLEAEKRELSEEVQRVTRQIDVLSKVIESIMLNGSFPI
jgi:hypothetical protein